MAKSKVSNSKKSIVDVFELQKARENELIQSPIEYRIKNLEKLKSWIEENRKAIQDAIYLDFKKPASEVDLSEIYVVLSEIKYALKHIRSWSKPQKVDSVMAMIGSKSYVHYEPKGVCLIIAPWNFPFNLAIGPLVSALAAGNSVIIKPSELSPNCSQLIEDMISDLFKPTEVAVFNGGKGIATELLKLPFDHVFFTGSPKVGAIVMEQAAKHLTSVTLELGGKSPAIVDVTADIEDAAEKLVWGKFINCGQTCIAPDYVLVDEKVEESLLEHMGRIVDKFYNPEGLGIDSSSSYARIIGDRHFDRLNNLLLDAVESGAEIEYGGQLDLKDRFLAPTILSNVSENMRVMQEEIFGPILPVSTYQNSSEVIKTVNSKPKPLALYIFSSSSEFTNTVLQSTSSGSVAINECVLQFMNPGLPFGGIGESGFGKSHGFTGFQAFSNQKSVLRQKTGLTSVKPLYPPYTKLTKKAIDFLLKYI